MQSPATLQTKLAAHLGHAPPQSTSVSLPFFISSWHRFATHTFDVAAQNVETQSMDAEHFLPLSHGAQTPPPQSTSVSFPFFMPSWHCSETHTCVELSQSKLAQSELDMHALPTTHPGQLVPPQSTSVSPALKTPSSQDDATQSDVDALQYVDAQSAPDVHDFPVSHFAQLPPQSTSLSVPSFSPFMQLGSTAMSGA
jgi:hypothetical protein